MTFLRKYIFDTILYSVMHDIVKNCTTVPPPQPPPPTPRASDGSFILHQIMLTYKHITMLTHKCL